MKKNQTTRILLSFLPFFVFGSFLLQNYVERNSIDIKPLGKGNIAALSRAYQQWKHNYQKSGGDQFLTISLNNDRKQPASLVKPDSKIKINLYTGEFTATTNNLPPDSDYELWLKGNLKSNTSETSRKLLGRLERSADGAYFLKSTIERTIMQEMYIDRIMISAQSKQDRTTALLAGSPSLFQKMFYHDKDWALTQLNGDSSFTLSKEKAGFFLLPKAAYANTQNRSLEAIFSEQIAKGRDLFINETFNGNGRTCETCHRLDNNHTIDPKYIAKLPDTDPLFIAENNPELAELERPKLLRQFGLILANIDGFDKPGVLRGVPHTLALGTSITPEAEHEGTIVTHAIGWSADGAPGDGSLRIFTVGAVIQHMPKTLNRLEDVDFRLPTDEELDAMEAYMLSLGRSEDLDLDNMFFSSPIVQKGRELFHSKEAGTGQCKGCHLNAGANSSTSLQNGNRDTGVENMPNNLLKMVWEPAPNDGGFGKETRNDCSWSKTAPCYGNQEFNMTTVVEAADTGPFFHNNSVNTIEEAVAFYNSNAFHNSPGATPADPNDPDSVCERCIHMEPTEVTAIALFLRTINAMENIRSSNDLDQQASQLRKHLRKELLHLAIAETEDAIEVLEGGAIIPNPESLKLLREALTIEKKAFHSRYRTKALELITKAIEKKQQANDLLLAESPA